MTKMCLEQKTGIGLKLDSWCELPTPIGMFRMYDAGDEHVRVVCYGDITNCDTAPLVRVHSSCLASEVFGALDCDCADQLRETMKMMATEGVGLIIHLHQEGRGQGLSNKIRAVGKMQKDGLDTYEAFENMGLEQDIRCYKAALVVLKELRISSVRLISNNPRKAAFLESNGVAVSPVNTNPVERPENSEYLRTKNSKLNHSIPTKLADKQNATIYFYHSDQPFGELSNFSSHAVFIDGCIWPTVEHFYQAQKFIDAKNIETIRCCKTPTLAKQLSSRFSPAVEREDWDDLKEDVMRQGLQAKFEQHPDLREVLLNTHNRTLVERSSTDSYWGDGGDGTGLNRLGHLLMSLRSELRSI